MRRPRLAAGILAAALLAVLAPSAAFAGWNGAGGGTIVFRDHVVETDHIATVMPGCHGTFVPMAFTGDNLYTVRIRPGGVVLVSAQIRETAAWTEDGIDQSVAFVNDWQLLPIDPTAGQANVFQITLDGHGTASDGSRTTTKLVGHVTVDANGVPTVDFVRGETVCYQ